MSGRIEITPP